MNENFNPSDEPIRLTREEAMSSQVDDLLSRQKSLTGQGGISRDKSGEAWYLKNWFLFGIAGALAAFAIWAFLEPYYDDEFYIQGQIESLDLAAAIPETVEFGYLRFETNTQGKGWLKIGEQRIWLSSWVQEYRNGDVVSLDPVELQGGREVGVYVHYVPVTSLEGFAVARYVVLKPAPPEKKATLSLAELAKRKHVASLILFPFIAGAIGLAIGVIEGAICRQFKRALIGGLIGLIVGLVGGFIAKIPGEMFYGIIQRLVIKQTAGSNSGLSPLGFFIQMLGRAMAWGLIGMAMGLGQGIALRSKRLLLYGFLGGVIGGLLGGLLFDPIYFFLQGEQTPSAHLSRMIGFTLIGLSVGVMIGVVQLLARDAWLRMTQGPLAGKEFLFFKDTMNIGASPKSEIYLFNDPHVMDHHATLRTVGDECEIESASKDKPVILNDRSIKRSKLRHGDRIAIGRTSFVFQMKHG